MSASALRVVGMLLAAGSGVVVVLGVLLVLRFLAWLVRAALFLDKRL